MSRHITGGRVTLTPTPDGGYSVKRTTLEDPMVGATDDELRAFEKYAGMSRLELMRALRRYQWDAEQRLQQVNALERVAREMPPLHLIQEMAQRIKRVRALTKVPRRRVVPVADLIEALDKRPSDAEYEPKAATS